MKFFLLVCFITSLSLPFHRKPVEYERRHAMDILRHQLPIPGETLASIVRVPNLYLEGDKNIKIWIPMKLFWKNYMKNNVGEDTGKITGIPKGRKVAFTAHKDTVPWRYTFVSELVDLKQYEKRKEDVNYVKVEDSEKEQAIILYGYIYGQNIVMTEEIGFELGENKRPAIYPVMLRSVKEGSAVDLKISKEYKFHISDRRVKSSSGLTDAPETESSDLDALDMEMVLPEHVIDSETSSSFTPNLLLEGYAGDISSNSETSTEVTDAELVKFMNE